MNYDATRVNFAGGGPHSAPLGRPWLTAEVAIGRDTVSVKVMHPGVCEVRPPLSGSLKAKTTDACAEWVVRLTAATASVEEWRAPLAERVPSPLPPYEAAPPVPVALCEDKIVCELELLGCRRLEEQVARALGVASGDAVGGALLERAAEVRRVAAERELGAAALALRQVQARMALAPAEPGTRTALLSAAHGRLRDAAVLAARARAE